VPLQMTVSGAELRNYVETYYPANGKLFKPW
jgi:hypothetical protein